MPYVNIKESTIVNAVAKQVGAVQEIATSKVYDLVNDSIQKVRREACPVLPEAIRLQNRVNNVRSSITNISTRINKFKKIAETILILVTVFNIIRKLVLKLPVPQSVPPGFGLPVAFSMIQTDLLHKFKEKIKQGEDDSKGILEVLKSPADNISMYTRILSRVNIVTNGCRLEGILKREVARGRITVDRLKYLGIIRKNKINEDEYIFSSIGSNLFTDFDFYRDGRVYEANSATGLSVADKNKIADDAETDFLSALDRLNGEDNQELKDAIKDVFDSYTQPSDDTTGDDANYYHTGPNGEVYELKIKLDPTSPEIAPRRFAVAIDQTGVEILKGPKSFSSSTKILLEEIKFRIDNQLP